MGTALQNNRREGAEPLDYKYPGTENLFLVETALARYNAWVVDKFISSFRGRQGSGTRVLDFGSGLGTLSRIFYQKTGIRPDAFDIDAMHRAEMEKSGFMAYANLDDMPSGYDLIFTSNVLEHIEDDTGTLRAIRAKLAVNGTLLVYVPAFAFLWTSMDDKVEHCRRYSRDDLCAKLRDAGYIVESTAYCDCVGFVLSLLFKPFDRPNAPLPIRSLAFFDRFLLPFDKILDPLFQKLFGKNLYVVARKA